ncbi:MAG: NAD(P)/FAD-dependent oxidoreductase [Patescibacteria group bacterium]
MQKRAVIIGAGPAGLTAAYELLLRTDIIPIVIERSPQYVGGISRTEVYNGNRIDIGGHRFFSKSDRVMRWWADMLPVLLEGGSTDITYQNSRRALTEGLRTAAKDDGLDVMLVRPRKTRIVYGGEFFAYPIELSFDTVRKLGFVKMLKIGVTYLQAALFPIKPEVTLEDFFINRFGSELYKTFFKSYTEKVWGTPCNEMTAEWGAQRVKGLSITKAILHALRRLFRLGPLSGKSVETSLIEQFLYPAFGPGAMWEKVVTKIEERGGEVRMNSTVDGIEMDGTRITHVRVNGTERIPADYVFSTTDMRALGSLLETYASDESLKVANGLTYRDFISVGLLLERRPTEYGMPLKDTWIYVHEPDVQVGRVQFFHNWSPHLVQDPEHGWVGLEYFCAEGDELWRMSDEALIALASEELEKIGLRQGISILGGHIIREPKAYPAYTGTYPDFAILRDELGRIENLFPIGRNGMHRYNNQDHSMLAAMTAVDNIVDGRTDSSNLWSINTEQEYHETK